MTKHDDLVAKVWNYAHVLRDQGVSYGDYVEQITYLLFLKMDQERGENLGEASIIPEPYRWNTLSAQDGEALEKSYREALEALSKKKGLVGILFQRAQNKLTDPAKLKRVVSLIDKETWIGLDVDTKGRMLLTGLEPGSIDIIHAVLRKPFQIEDLAATIRSALESAEAAQRVLH